MVREHSYRIRSTWEGDRGTGTSGYRDYDRNVRLQAPGKDAMAGSADAAFHGDRARWNPEELLVAALSECHLLSYLHVCVTEGVTVVGYTDDAEGTMAQSGLGGAFTEVVLRPRVTVTDAAMVDAAVAAHKPAHEYCFIANSVNFPVRVEPVVAVAEQQ
ncbi:OsmC family protein [Gordonia phthalatica]|uniref:Peroxiredoxin n=1 Tax=Gordonia phthalatica TaxID=1136941 RepID=A0A0N9NAN8_9ACTN|nr:OsmC family protein [Gordonia phthalatica]ALG84077.1 peroxiredoxin [Gordonia phthalatica]